MNHSFHHHELSDLTKQFEEILSASVKSKKEKKIENIDIEAHTFYCEICYNDKDINEIMYLKCNHYFCKPCFKEYFEFHITQSGKVYMIKCPNIGCKEQVYESEVRVLIQENTFEKYKKLRLNFEVSRSSNKKFCPFPECQGVVIGNKN
jgi:ariadne-1